MIILQKKSVFKKISTFIALYAAFAVIFCFFSCSKSVKRKSNIDTPNDHYKIGIQKLDTNDLKTAETEFVRAIELDENSPLGYTGMAFLELNRSNFKRALKHAKKAIKKDRNFTDAYIAQGYAIAARKHGNKWFEEALEYLKKALSINSNSENERALFYLAECYYEARKYEKALEYFTKTFERNGSFAERSNKRITFVKKIAKVEPLTDEVREVAEKDKINRADLCILLIEKLKLKNLLYRYRPEKLAELNIKVKSEIDNNKAKKWIIDVIHVNMPFFDLYPDGNFYPDRLVTKSLLAVVMQWVLVLVNADFTISTKFIGLNSQFNDVHTNYYAFNAINLCIEKGIMNFPENGNFNPDSPVSGIDAILMLRALMDSTPAI